MRSDLHHQGPQMGIFPTVKRVMNLNAAETVLTQPKSSQDESSLPDSGYGSSLPSPDQNENHEKEKRIISFSKKAIPCALPNQKGLLVFKKDVDLKTNLRFNEIVPEVERLLLSHIKSSSRVFSKSARSGPMAIRLVVLGKSEDDAKEHIVVFCPAALYKRVQRFFNKEKVVKELCEPSDPAVPSFKVVVNGQAPRLRASLSEVQVFCATLEPSNGTFCGRPISLVDDRGDVRYATFGGVVKVSNSNGSKLYGLTTGHSLLDWQDPETSADEPLSLAEEEAEEVYSDDDASEGLLESEDPSTRGVVTFNMRDKGEASNSWAQGSEELGNISKFPHIAEGSSRQFFDWALFELNRYMPNLLVAAELSGNTKRPLNLKIGTITPDLLPQAVVMLGSSSGPKSGVLSILTGRIKIGPGESFTNAYMLALDDGLGTPPSKLLPRETGANMSFTVSDGDSGAWVVDPVGGEVYGHVVATDMFGDAYVIPMGGILEDMKWHLGAESVDLPSSIDFSIVALASHPGRMNSTHLDGCERTTPDPVKCILSGEEEVMDDFLDSDLYFFPGREFGWQELVPLPSNLGENPTPPLPLPSNRFPDPDSAYGSCDTTPTPSRRKFMPSPSSMTQRADKKVKLGFDEIYRPRTPENQIANPKR